MSWVNKQLGDVLTLKRGYDLPTDKRIDGDIPIISSSGITGYHNEAKVSGPGVVTGRYGTLGEVYYIDEPYWPLNTSLYVKDFKGNDEKFISYFLKSVLRGTQSDKAAVPGVNRNDLHARYVDFPDVLSEQKKIAKILFEYDKLIENNNRRIQLLEETARLLYKEWFVFMRFPGHEHVNFVDGLPEGWNKMTLGEIITLNYGKALKADDRIEGDYPVFGSSGEIGTHNKALVEGPGIIVGRKGNVGSVYWTAKNYWPIDTVYFINSEQSNFFLYYILQSMNFINTDGAVPGLNRDFAYSRPIVTPDKEIVDNFIDEVSPIRQQIEKLTEYNKKLSQARDLLLPRLMNGDIAV